MKLNYLKLCRKKNKKDLLPLKLFRLNHYEFLKEYSFQIDLEQGEREREREKIMRVQRIRISLSVVQSTESLIR